MPVSNASPNKQRHQWREQMQDYQHEKQHEAFSLVEQKRREAMAIYESPDLYLEPGEQQREEDFDQQPNISYTDSSSNSASLANAEFVDLDENEPPNQATTAFSPRSAATEPHSNKREATYKNKKGFSKRDSTGSQDSSSSSVNSSFDQKKTSGKKNKSEEPEEGATGENRRGRISTGGLRSKTPERRGRGRSLEKPSSADSPEKEKKGFFRKLFRGKKKSLGRMEDSHHSIEEEAAPDTDILPPNKMSSGPRVSFRPVHEQLNDDALSAHSSKARSVVSLEVETHQAGNVNNAGRSRDREQQELEFGLNTVTSGLTNDMDPERRDIFFAHDEVSTLTAPSAHSYGRRSIDPQEAGGSTGGNSSEPVGRYWNDDSNQKAQNSHNVTSPTIDPFTEPFFQEPDGESPITSKKVTRSKTPRQEDSLHVNVPTSLEPTGETPRAHANEPSPRGWQSPITELKDPTGSTYSATPRRSSTGEANNTSQKEHKDRKLCTKRKLPHELQREPSAFRDGPPYALDPPLRMHEFDDNGNPKSLIGILSKRPTTTKSNNDRVAAEPPTSTLTEQSRTQEVQPPTPTLRPEEKKEEEPTSPFDEPDKLVAPTTLAEEKAVTDAQFIPSKTTKEECKDDAGFLDELFQENTRNKKPSLVRPISITFANGSDSDKGTQPSSPQPHAAEIHRTQRLSISPRSCKDVSYTPEKLSEAKVGVAPSSTAHDLSAVLQRRRQHISNDEEEEEKKETESYHSHAIIEESSVSGMSDKMLATGTTALSTAASMNAQTVRYLHTLNGEPSPRHSWRRAELSDDEYSPVKSKVQRQAVANIKSAMSKKNFVAVCRSDEAAFENFISGKEKAITSTASGSNSLHQSKLVQKKPLNIRTRNKVGNLSPRSRKMAKENYKRPIHYFYQRCNRDVRVKGAPLSYGLELLRKQRQSAILSGRAIPVRPKKSLKKRSLASSQFQPLREEDIKDPIQRAGMRLLSKAAIPIQSAARKYLARREAESRLSAAIALQSYFRRWKCEAYLQGCRYTSTKIQAAFRSWMVREELAYQHFQATQIQKVVRSYIASAYVHDAIYWVARLQAVMRGKLSRTRLAKLKQLREMSALCLQSWYRGCVARKQVGKCIKAISTIQATCRSYAARVSYQVAVIDIIIVQGVVRQFLARKQLEKKQLEKMSNAACKIQATWRGFQGYTDYIFALVDILVIQRSMRKWLAKKKVDSMRKHLAATKIQAQWRRQTALIGMLYDLVHIIIAQVSAFFACILCIFCRIRFLIKLNVPFYLHFYRVLSEDFWSNEGSHKSKRIMSYI